MIIPTNQNIKSVTDMREKTVELLEDVESLGLVYLFVRTNPKAVILSMSEFTRIQEMLEDRMEEIEAEKLSSQDRGKGMTLESVKKELRIK